MQPLECCGSLPGRCYAATKVFWVIARGLLRSYQSVVGCCQGVAMQALKCFGLLPGGFYAVARVLWLVAGGCYAVARVLWVVAAEFSSYSLFNLSTDIKVISFETSMF